MDEPRALKLLRALLGLPLGWLLALTGYFVVRRGHAHGIEPPHVALVAVPALLLWLALRGSRLAAAVYAVAVGGALVLKPFVAPLPDGHGGGYAPFVADHVEAYLGPGAVVLALGVGLLVWLGREGIAQERAAARLAPGLTLCLAAGVLAGLVAHGGETTLEAIERRRPAYEALVPRLARIAARLRSGPTVSVTWKPVEGQAPIPRLARAEAGSGNTALEALERLEAPWAQHDARRWSTLDTGLGWYRPGRGPEQNEAWLAPAWLQAGLDDGLAMRYLAVHRLGVPADVAAPGAAETVEVWLVDLPSEAPLLHRVERGRDLEALERMRLPADRETRALMLLDDATGGLIVPGE